MNATQIANIIKSRCVEKLIYVLRGIPTNAMVELGEALLDRDFIIDNNRLDLTQIKRFVVLNKVLSCQKLPCFITMESMIALNNTIKNIDEIGKPFCIVNNNCLVRYKNPSNFNIPDFETSEFQTESSNEVYCQFYSYCEHINGVQLIQYVEPDFSLAKCISQLSIFKPLSLENIKEQSYNSEIPTLAIDNDSLPKLLEQIFYGPLPQHKAFALPKNSNYTDIIGVLLNMIQLLELDIELYWIANPSVTIVRPELLQTLKNIWGYTSFRKLKMYKDLDYNKDIMMISQGEIIENVVRESENALKGKDYKNILLTSPTGAGKSLLFQLSAIYLAEQYKTLTIVISPLLALMEDQVANLSSLYPKTAALNSSKSAAEQFNIIQQIQNGNINILYLAPELLLSHSLSSLIGDRQLGLIVIDEAHTVTTWGRDFRVDYWFLGDYLRTTKKYLNYSFPIFALTATAVWDPSRKNDMVFETISSLNMNPCIKYIGVVRRDNIIFEISRPEKVRDYEKQRLNRTALNIQESLVKNRKTIVYFPYISTIKKVLDLPAIQPYRLQVTEFHSKLSSIEKKTNANNFKKGLCPIICASKAFGMGIDVSDITEVYHHAPTGNLSDYVQEIGRLARDEKLIGIAKIDFNEQDFKYTRQLHGLSTIKPYQLKLVLKKLMELYFIRGEKRNMLISPSDFEYIFPDSSDIDQKFKSCLLLISHDLIRTLRFPALIVRAKNIFADIFIEVSQQEALLFYNKYKIYCEPIDINNGRFLLHGEKFWTDNFSSISFALFKKKLMNNQIFKDFYVAPITKIEIVLNKDLEYCDKFIRKFFNDAESILNKLASAKAGEPKHIKYRELKQKLIGYSTIEKEAFLHSFILMYAKPLNDSNDSVYCQIKFKENEDDNQISLSRHGFETIKSQFVNLFSEKITSKKIYYYCTQHNNSIRLGELLNSLGIATFQKLGGADPQVFVRINNPAYLQDLANSTKYTNKMLMDIYDKYKYSEELFTYFFSTDMTTRQRWDFIEAYFLGASKEELLHFTNNEHIFHT